MAAVESRNTQRWDRADPTAPAVRAYLPEFKTGGRRRSGCNGSGHDKTKLDGIDPMRATIAIVGGGAAGIAAAHQLVGSGHQVMLLEAAPQLGGNCVGASVFGDDGSLHKLDLGVSDFNARTFSTVKALFDDLGVSARPIVQDASFARPDGKTLWFIRDGEPHFSVELSDERRFRGEMARFRAEACEVLEDPAFDDWTLGRYVAHRGYSDEVYRLYLEPRAMGCFPTPQGDVAGLSIRALVAFWKIHGLVGAEVSERMAVVGGMHRYVERFTEAFVARGGALHTSTSVLAVERHGVGVVIHAQTATGERRSLDVDHVIFATPPQTTRRMIADISLREDESLGRMTGQRALVFAHRDTALMPDDRDAWCAYNYVVVDGCAPRHRPTITFYPNRLAGLSAEVPDVFVSMNPHTHPQAEHVVAVKMFEHPLFRVDADARSRAMRDLQGRRRTWFAGSYLQEPYVHEQAMASGVSVAHELVEELRLAGPSRSRRHDSVAPVSSLEL